MQIEQAEAQNEQGFTFSKILITRLLLISIKNLLDSYKDPKSQFNSLLLMDTLFSTVYGGPSLDSEIAYSFSNQKPQKKVQVIDLDTFAVKTNDKFKYDEESYLHMRLQSILKLWPLLQGLIVSPWSNIRSLSYGVICNWVRPDLHHYKSSLQKQFCQIIFSTLLGLLQSKDSECRTGGLNILGSLCGLSYNYDRKQKFIK